MPYATFIRDWAAFNFNMIAVIPPHMPVARAAGAGAVTGRGTAGMRRD